MARTQPNTQRGDVLNHLKTFGSITSWEAIKEYGVISLPSRIRELKDEGYLITVKQYSHVNRYGKTIWANRYYLTKPKIKFTDFIKKFKRKEKNNG